MPAWRASCDSVVALAEKTRSRRPIFAKNSDRPPDECQPLVQVAAADHPSGSPLRCQYVEIDQVAHTYAFIGARPYWLWGLEHGVNEHGVAIGNHTIFTKDPVADTGLLGMDLVRLGLERGTTAEEALEVVIDLIERHGQGGSGYVDVTWPYHNSFLVADAERAFLLEASAEHWALAEVAGGASASNHTTIGTQWTRLSRACRQHAVDMGWSSGGEERFDFAAAYRDLAVVPPVLSSGRHATTCEALAAADGDLDVDGFKRLMRDHYEAGDHYVPGAQPDDERFFSVCEHAGIAGTTTASMIVELDPSAGAASVCRVAFCNPCIAPYLPLLPIGELPAELTRGGADASSGGAWWQFKALRDEVEKDWVSRGPGVRDVWRRHERELDAEIDSVCATLRTERDAGAARRQATEIMADHWVRTAARLADLTAELRAS
jgi:secernin